MVAELFRQKSRFPQLYGALIVAVLLGITVFFFFGVLRKLVIGRWYDESGALTSPPVPIHRSSPNSPIPASVNPHKEQT